MKRIICLVLVAVMLSSVTIYAATEKAYSIGMDYKNDTLDTSSDATNAASDFGLAGYSSYYSITPTYSYVLDRIENEIFFFSGHGTIGRAYFNAEGTSTPFHITTNFVQSSTSPYSIQLDDVDLSSTKLMTFGSCQSARAGTDDSGTYRSSLIYGAVYLNDAETAVGWRESLDASPHSLWLLRYTNQLAVGDTVQEAIDYANMWSYSDNDVVDSVRVYGNENLVIKINKSQSSIENIVERNGYKLVLDEEGKDLVKAIKFDKNNAIKVDVKSIDTTEIINCFTEITGKKLSLNNPVVEIVEMRNEELKQDSNCSYIVRIKETVNGINTNSELVAIIRDNCIVNLCDNTIAGEIPSLEVTKKINSFDALNLKIPDDYKLENMKKELIYDFELGKYVYKIKLDMFNMNEKYSVGEIRIIDALAGDLIEK